jgi:hypothetical protein
MASPAIIRSKPVKSPFTFPISFSIFENEKEYEYLRQQLNKACFYQFNDLAYSG